MKRMKLGEMWDAYAEGMAGASEETRKYLERQAAFNPVLEDGAEGVEALTAAVWKTEPAILVSQRRLHKYAEEMRGWGDMLAAEAQRIDLGGMWDKAKGSLKSYNAAIKKAIEDYKSFGANAETLKGWFSIPASVMAKIGEMPGLAKVMVDKGKEAAEATVKGITEVMALGGDPAAQAWLRDWGTPEARVKVLPVGYASWAALGVGSATGFMGGWPTPTARVNVRPSRTPQYAEGGPVSGPTGQPQLAIVHGGEHVSTQADMKDMVAELRALRDDIKRLPRQYQLAARTA